MKTKTMAMFALLMIALSIAGFVYAHWSDMIKINGYVQMGSLSVGFTNVNCTVYKWWNDTDGDDFPDPDELVKQSTLDPAKQVVNASCTLDEEFTDHKSNKTGYKKIHFSMNNTYPSIVFAMTFNMTNTGTIPVDWTDFNFTLWQLNKTSGLWEEITYVPCEIFYVWHEPTYTLPYQIDPCHTETITACLLICQSAPPCNEFKGEFRFYFQQWN